jgi:hypothetical protein
MQRCSAEYSRHRRPANTGTSNTFPPRLRRVGQIRHVASSDWRNRHALPCLLSHRAQPIQIVFNTRCSYPRSHMAVCLISLRSSSIRRRRSKSEGSTNQRSKQSQRGLKRAISIRRRINNGGFAIKELLGPPVLLPASHFAHSDSDLRPHSTANQPPTKKPTNKPSQHTSLPVRLSEVR